MTVGGRNFPAYLIGAFVGVILSVIATIGWFLAGNPYGVDSSYLALAVPLLSMGISHAFKQPPAQAPTVPTGLSTAPLP